MAIVQQTSGMSAFDFARVRPGRALPDPNACLKIQCGAMTQDQAGELLADCAFAGFAGARSCIDPLCVGDFRAPYCSTPAPVNAGPTAMANTPSPRPAGANSVFLPGVTGQELAPVLCPRDGVPSDYMAGLNTWTQGVWSIIQKAMLFTDLPAMEMAGYLTPVALIAAGLIAWGVSGGEHDTDFESDASIDSND